MTTYEQCKEAFMAWAERNAYDPQDRELWDAFFGGVKFVEEQQCDCPDIEQCETAAGCLKL